MKRTVLRMSGRQHAVLQAHLFPGDGCEAVALAACGRHSGAPMCALMIHEILPIPHLVCSTRSPETVAWPTDIAFEFLDRAAASKLSVLKIHSHPGGYDRFSAVDDGCDRDFFSSVYSWIDGEGPHASAVMLPGGRVFARAILPDGSFNDVDCVSVAGNDIQFWHAHAAPAGAVGPDFAARHRQMFGAGTIARLRQLTVGIVGCSGTGSPVIEMLARLGVGSLVLVDPDVVEEKNLNRILNATLEDAVLRRPKVHAVGAAVARMGLGTRVMAMPCDLADPHAIRALAECDVIFGCMDGAFGRSLLNRLATFYSLPYFDLGVAIDADGQGGVSEASGHVHYLQPDGSTLMDRGVLTAQQVQAEGLLRTNKADYEARVRAGYLRGVREDRPAVISINMQTAAAAVNEFLARLHPYRVDGNDDFAEVHTSFSGGFHLRARDSGASRGRHKMIGRGEVKPLLDMPATSSLPTGGGPQ